jgi:hypothetical protein
VESLADDEGFPLFDGGNGAFGKAGNPEMTD